jgi:hypothetical protein
MDGITARDSRPRRMTAAAFLQPGGDIHRSSSRRPRMKEAAEAVTGNLRRVSTLRHTQLTDF